MTGLKRITYKRIFQEVMEILNLERGMLYTFKELTLRPGKTVRTYLFTDRNKIFNPFRYAFIGVALQVFMSIKSKGFASMMDAQASIANLEEGTNPEQQEFVLEGMGIFFETLNVTTMLSIPLIAFFTFLVMNSEAWTKAEHTVANSYIVGHSGFYSAICLLPSVFSTSLIFIIISGIVPYLLFFYMGVKIFKEKAFVGSIKYLFSLLIGTTLVSIPAMIVIFAYLAWSKGMF